MSRIEIFLWVAFPWLSIVAFVIGVFWRWRTDQFGWDNTLLPDLRIPPAPLELTVIPLGHDVCHYWPHHGFGHPESLHPCCRRF